VVIISIHFSPFEYSIPATLEMIFLRHKQATHSFDFTSTTSSQDPDLEAVNFFKELLEQFTQATPKDQGTSYSVHVILLPYTMNGQARGYRLVEPQDRTCCHAT